MIEGDSVATLQEVEGGFSITTKKGTTMTTKSILICSGASRRVLDVEGAERLNHKGISYCASCDAPLFKGVPVVVVGGGNAGFESALQLLDYATEVYLFERDGEFRADSITIDKTLQNSKMKAFNNVSIVEIKGENKVESVVYSVAGEEGQKELPVAVCLWR